MVIKSFKGKEKNGFKEDSDSDDEFKNNPQEKTDKNITKILKNLSKRRVIKNE